MKEVVASTIFTKQNGQWYWRTKALNNEIVADGAEGYKNIEDAINGFFVSQGIRYDKNHWPDGYEFVGLSDNQLQIKKYTK
jgi:hypothetical protein